MSGRGFRPKAGPARNKRMSEQVLFLVSVLPIIWLFIAFCIMRLPGHLACSGGLLIVAILAVTVMGMSRMELITAAFEGVLFALWPIFIIVTSAMVLYKYSVATGGMDTIKTLLTGFSRDKRILVLLLAWGFGGFLEGIAGFGVPVLIPGSILVSLGFSPLFSVLACLVANSVPTPFASVGIPVLTLSGVTGLESDILGFNVAMQLFIPCLVLPFFLVMLTGGGARAIRGVGMITLIAGLSFAVPLLLVTRFMGPQLPTLLGSVCSMVAIAAASKRLYKDDGYNKQFQIESNLPTMSPPGLPPAPVSAFQACLPFGIVLVLISALNLAGPLREALAKVRMDAAFYAGEGGRALSFEFILAPGVLIFLSTLLACLLQRQSLKGLFRIAGGVLLESKKMLITIVTVVALAKIMDYSGMTSAIAIMLISVFAGLYPLVAPVIGMLGTFITGSDTTCCVLFGSLQANAARAIGVDPAWIASSNLSAAAAGKMISPQSVAIGLRVGGIDGREGEIIRKALKYALLCTAIVCLTTYLVVIYG